VAKKKATIHLYETDRLFEADGFDKANLLCAAKPTPHLWQSDFVAICAQVLASAENFSGKAETMSTVADKSRAHYTGKPVASYGEHYRGTALELRLLQ
jgi:hypothetical protein